MNRLTRKTTKEDYERKAKSYWMSEDESTSDQFIEKFPYTVIKGFSFLSFNEYLNKLGRFEDLEEQLGCPLEVVFEALENGVYCVDFDNQVIRKFKAPLCFNSTSKEFYWNGTNIGYPDLKDYQKTWWLKDEFKEEE